MKHIKITFSITALTVFFSLACQAWNTREEFLMYTCLSQQIKACEIAGAGIVISNTPSTFQISVDNYFYGSESNLLTLALDDEQPDQSIPLVGSNLVFFATSNLTNAYDLLMLPDTLRFDYSPLATNRVTNSAVFYLPGNSRAYFYSNAEEGALLQYASNLVHTLRFTRNLDDYYNLIRTGTTNPQFETLSIRESRCHALTIAAQNDNTNMLWKIALDTNSIPFLRNIAAGRLVDEFGVTNLPPLVSE